MTTRTLGARHDLLKVVGHVYPDVQEADKHLRHSAPWHSLLQLSNELQRLAKKEDAVLPASPLRCL